MEAFRTRKPSITSKDSRWRDNYQLLRYEIQADGQTPAGYDRQCRVVLWLLGPDGNETEETAMYTVSIHPSIVIVRVES